MAALLILLLSLLTGGNFNSTDISFNNEDANFRIITDDTSLEGTKKKRGSRGG